MCASVHSEHQSSSRLKIFSGLELGVFRALKLDVFYSETHFVILAEFDVLLFHIQYLILRHWRMPSNDVTV